MAEVPKPEEVQTILKQQSEQLAELIKRLNEAFAVTDVDIEAVEKQTKAQLEKTMQETTEKVKEQDEQIKELIKTAKALEEQIKKAREEKPSATPRGQPTRIVKVEMPPPVKLTEEQFSYLYDLSIAIMSVTARILMILPLMEKALDARRLSQTVRDLTNSLMQILDLITYGRIQIVGAQYAQGR